MRVLLTIAMLLSAIPANAQLFDSGNRLHGLCKDLPEFMNGYVAGWLEKFQNDRLAVSVDYLTYSRDERHEALSKTIVANICLPQELTLQQTTDVICKFLNDNPKERHLTAAYHLTHALSEAYPCR